MQYSKQKLHIRKKALKKAHIMRKNGFTLQEIGDTLGITREAVRQMLVGNVDNSSVKVLDKVSKKN